MPTRADTPTGVVLMDLKTKARFGIEGAVCGRRRRLSSLEVVNPHDRRERIPYDSERRVPASRLDAAAIRGTGSATRSIGRAESESSPTSGPSARSSFLDHTCDDNPVSLRLEQIRRQRRVGLSSDENG